MQSRENSYLSFASQANHNSWLDLLRSVAIFLVLFRHGSVAAENGATDGFIANIFRNGWVGVDLFFVLSGYLIAGGLIRRSESSDKLFPAGYFRDRILRIVPAYYAVLFLCILGLFPGYFVDEDNLVQSLIAHLLLLQDYTGANINVVFWSLGVEEKFYIAAPFIVFVLWKPTHIRLGAALAVLLLLASPISRALAFEGMGDAISYDEFFRTLRSPFHMSLDCFVVGILVAIARAKGMVPSQKHAVAGLAGSAAVLLAWLGSHEFLVEISRVDVWFQPSALAILFGLMVWCAASLPDRTPAFEPFFRVNARLSYSLYLIHYPLIPLALVLAHGQHIAAFWTVYVLLSYAGALLLHFSVEKPFLILKQRSANSDRRKVSMAPTKASAS